MERICKNMGSRNRQPQCLIISGIDGSGKTTIINTLKSDLEKNGLKVGYIWLRFNHYLTKGMHAIARLTGLSVKVTNELGVVWQHQLYKSRLFCFFYIITTYVDCLISRLKFNKTAKGNDIVICDRWITDIIVDLATKTHDKTFITSQWAKRFLSIAPNGSNMIVISRNLNALLNCRLENRVDPDFNLRLEIYTLLLSMPYINVVDNNGTIEQSINQIKNILNNKNQ